MKNFSGQRNTIKKLSSKKYQSVHSFHDSANNVVKKFERFGRAQEDISHRIAALTKRGERVSESMMRRMSKINKARKKAVFTLKKKYE